MIDVNEEIQKYKAIDINDNNFMESEVPQLLNIFNKTVERISKNQYKHTRNIEEIIETLDEINSKEKLLIDFQERFKAKEDDEKKLVTAIVEIIDYFEDIYEYSKRSLNQGFAQQMSFQWKKIEQTIAKYGINRFGNVGDAFSRQLHLVKEVREEAELSEIQVLEVIKSGYIYKGNIIRKSEVVINNIVG